MARQTYNPEMMVQRAREMYAVYLDLMEIRNSNIYASKRIALLDKNGQLDYIIRESGGQRAHYPTGELLLERGGKDNLSRRLRYLGRCRNANVSGEEVRRREREERREQEEGEGGAVGTTE